MKNKVLIIAGMHRSGTSLISHWLDSCGLNLGETLLEPDIGNIEGHYEDVDFYRFHEDTLAANNLSRFGFISHPAPALSHYQREKLKSIIDFKNKMNNQWGWKDPRTCLFLDTYYQLLPNAFYLNVVRDYKSTVNSLVKRDFDHHEIKYLSRNRLQRFIWHSFKRKHRKRKFYRQLTADYLRIWIAYNEEILKNIETLPADRCMTIDYQNLLDHDTRVFGTLVNDWGFDLEYFDFRRIFKANLLSPVYSVDNFVKDGSLLQKAKALEDKLKAYVLN